MPLYILQVNHLLSSSSFPCTALSKTNQEGDVYGIVVSGSFFCCCCGIWIISMPHDGINIVFVNGCSDFFYFETMYIADCDTFCLLNYSFGHYPMSPFNSNQLYLYHLDTYWHSNKSYRAVFFVALFCVYSIYTDVWLKIYKLHQRQRKRLICQLLWMCEIIKT